MPIYPTSACSIDFVQNDVSGLNVEALNDFFYSHDAALDLYDVVFDDSTDIKTALKLELHDILWRFYYASQNDSDSKVSVGLLRKVIFSLLSEQ